ncbi:protein TonB [Halospina denitrificans]|uniref:Protein TonB n=1 Tax=Halospina denitrificans TaxID=332522 RepID=A0A4R7JZN4_9GAMM|nr:energy transducer TonB [Halospina denitrificans]TDT44010.1 protein TonB [Halospina denitrificans]
MADAVSHADRFGFTLFMALVFHGVLILGLGFAPEDPEPTDKSLDVTMANRPSEEAPEDADFLAEADQKASGDQQEVQEMTTTERTSVPDPRMAETTPPPSEPEAPETGAATETVTTTGESERSIREEPEPEREQAESDPHESLMERSRNIASLQARLSNQRNQYAKRPRVTRVTSVSTMQDVGAAYVRSWQETIERTGNLNYPEEARRRGLHGEVRMLVSINADGSLRELEVLQSSGHAILDDAARRIVRQASPFEPFGKRMAEQQDVLEIIRTWSFQRRGLSGSAPGAG